MPSREFPVTNLLIDFLPKKQRENILKLCTSVDLEFGSILHEANKPYQHVYFPVSGFISRLAKVADHPPLEMGLIGNEGMLGSGVVLGVNLAAMQSIVQGSGTALQIPVAQFEGELRKNSNLIILFNRYIYTIMQQLTQSAICIHYHDIEMRLARWLLMTHDRAHKNTFFLTHIFLAHMLGVRRSGVSLAASALRKRNLIAYSRGEITILDRAGLEAASCGCYREMIETYKWILIGKGGK